MLINGAHGFKQKDVEILEKINEFNLKIQVKEFYLDASIFLDNFNKIG